jgi:hypothetical protein
MDVPGADRLVRVYGRWPSFHDAEVLRFVFDRGETLDEGPTAIVELHVFEMTNEVDKGGGLILRNHTLVRFRFAGIDELTMGGFNHQNAIWDLVIENIAERQLEWVKYEVTLVGSFGVEAHFLCHQVFVDDVQSYEPPTRRAG